MFKNSCFLCFGIAMMVTPSFLHAQGVSQILGFEHVNSELTDAFSGTDDTLLLASFTEPNFKGVTAEVINDTTETITVRMGLAIDEESGDESSVEYGGVTTIPAGGAKTIEWWHSRKAPNKDSVKGRVWVEDATTGIVIPLPPGADGGIVEGKDYAWKRVTGSGDPAPDGIPTSMGL